MNKKTEKKQEEAKGIDEATGERDYVMVWQRK